MAIIGLRLWLHCPDLTIYFLSTLNILRVQPRHIRHPSVCHDQTQIRDLLTDLTTNPLYKANLQPLCSIPTNNAPFRTKIDDGGDGSRKGTAMTRVESLQILHITWDLSVTALYPLYLAKLQKGPFRIRNIFQIESLRYFTHVKWFDSASVYHLSYIRNKMQALQQKRVWKPFAGT